MVNCYSVTRCLILPDAHLEVAQDDRAQVILTDVGNGGAVSSHGISDWPLAGLLDQASHV